MSAEFVMRSVAIMACATTLSLFTTIAAYAAVNVAAAKSDGVTCRTAACASALAAVRSKTQQRTQVARIPARAS